jgi:hypothetical protein
MVPKGAKPMMKMSVLHFYPTFWVSNGTKILPSFNPFPAILDGENKARDATGGIGF